ncbi:MAG: hypothetical protein MJZ23_09485 [Paludibacteraceae bacterium]|nr:hypothetical protein [Paludibacteraceae bacterium]
MKKTIIVATVLLLSGCGISSNKPRIAQDELEAYITSIDSATTALENAQNAEDFKRITSNFKAKAEAFANTHKESEATRELLERIALAGLKYQETANKKVKEISIKEAAHYKSLEEDSSREE